MKIAIVGYNLFGVGGTSRSNINLMSEFLDVDDLEITYYNIRKIPLGAVSRFKRQHPELGNKIKYKHFTKIFEDEAHDVFLLTRENLFVLSKAIKRYFPDALVIGEVHAPLPQIQPELDLAKDSIDVYRVATERSKENFAERLGPCKGKIIPFPVSIRHLTYDKKLSFQPVKSKNLYIYSRFDELQKDISYAIRLMDYLVNYLGDHDFKLYLNGTGSGEKLYESLIEFYKLEKNVFINKQIPDDGIYLSTARNETFGYSISEAFTAGKRVLLYGGDDSVIKDIYGGFKTFGWLTKDIESDAKVVIDYCNKSFSQEDYQNDIDEALSYSIKKDYGQAFIDKLILGQDIVRYEGDETAEEVIDYIYAHDTAAKTSFFSSAYNFAIKNIPGVKKLLTQDKIHTILQKTYNAIHKSPEITAEIRDDFLFVESFHGKSFAGDPKYMALAMEQQIPHLQVFVSSASDLVDDEILSYGYSPVRLGSPNYVQKFKQCRFVITNGNTLDKCGKRDGQIFVETWHGLPLKKMVHDLENAQQRKEESEAFLPRMMRWDYLTTSSSYNTELFRTAFMLDQNKSLTILEEGAPRNGYLMAKKDDAKEVNRLHEKYFNRPGDGKKYVLYCPTWRKGNRKTTTGLNLVSVVNQLPNDYEIIVKLHPLEGELRGQYANLSPRIHCFFNETVDIQELFLLSKVLITDYSSAMFDYAHLDRKIIVLQEDAEAYTKQIGWYFDTEALLGIKGQQLNEEELVTEILNESTGYLYNQLIVDKLMNQDSPNSAEKITQELLQQI